jgi:CHRD domain
MVEIDTFVLTKCKPIHNWSLPRTFARDVGYIFSLQGRASYRRWWAYEGKTTVVVVCLGSAGGLGARPFSTELTGAEEVDPVTAAVGVGDPDGSGTATITLNPGQEEVCFELTVADIDTPIGAHIHEGAAGTNGPVVVGLDPLPPTGDSSSSECVSLERQEIIEILRDPSNYYVNVHTGLFPDGAIRGQLP